MPFETWGLIGLFSSAFISSTLAPGGSEAVLAYLIYQHQHPVANLVAIASIGNTLGAITTWWMGAWAANKCPAENLLTESRRKPLNAVRRWGGWALLFSWLPVVGDGLCFAAGWLRLAPLTSMLAIFFGKTLRYTAVAYALDQFI